MLDILCFLLNFFRGNGAFNAYTVFSTRVLRKHLHALYINERDLQVNIILKIHPLSLNNKNI